MTNYINPIDSANAYANTALADVGKGSLPNPVVRGPGSIASQIPSVMNRKARATTPFRAPQELAGGPGDFASSSHDQWMQNLQRSRSVARGAAYGSLPSRAGGKSSLRAPQGGFSGAFTGGVYGLTPGAGAAFQRLNAAYRQRFGTDLVVNSGGRSRQEQARAYALYKSGRGNLAAPPGSSVHESGRAVDFGGPIQNAGSVQHQWLQANAGRFGWQWTGKNFAQFEPWHWEYHG